MNGSISFAADVVAEVLVSLDAVAADVSDATRVWEETFPGADRVQALHDEVVHDLRALRSGLGQEIRTLQDSGNEILDAFLRLDRELSAGFDGPSPGAPAGTEAAA